jgi:hypothetical protein
MRAPARLDPNDASPPNLAVDLADGGRDDA